MLLLLWWKIILAWHISPLFRDFFWTKNNSFTNSNCVFKKQVFDSSGLLGVEIMKRQEHTLRADVDRLFENRKKSLQGSKKMNWPKKKKCMDYCVGLIEFNADGCFLSEGWHNSPRLLDQWLRFGRQPFPAVLRPPLKKPPKHSSAHYFYLWIL